jgi:uncharacterized protein YciI
MYAIAVIRYRAPIERIQEITDEHRAYLRELQAKGTLLAAGPMVPRFGGAILLRVPDAGSDEALNAIRDGDPFVKKGAAQYELVAWAPVIGTDALDRL